MNPGSPGFAMPPAEDGIVRQLKDLWRAVRENAAARSLESSQIGKGGLRVTDGGSITIEAPGQLIVASGVLNSAGSITAVTDISAGGKVIGNAGLTSLGVYNTDVTALPGARTSVWVHVSGVLGQTVSTIVKKLNLRDQLPFTAADILSIVPYIFEYRAQVEIRDDPENPYYDPSYVVPTEIGMMAEHLVDAGLGLFVEYETDGITPAGINYTLFGAVAAVVIGRAQEDRMNKLEARIVALETSKA